MRPEAGLIATGILFAGLLVVLAGHGTHTHDWIELACGGGVLGAALTVRPCLRWMAGAGAAKVPWYWVAIAAVLLFLFWAGAATTLNTTLPWRAQLANVEGRVVAKRVVPARYADSHVVEIDTPRGNIELGMPRDLWAGVAVGARVGVLLCRGAFAYAYLVTPLDRDPYLDIARLWRGADRPNSC